MLQSVPKIMHEPHTGGSGAAALIDLSAARALPVEGRSEIVVATKDGLAPFYPGDPRHPEARQRLFTDYDPLPLLEEFAGNPMGTAEFGYADRLRARVKGRLEGGPPSVTIDYIYGAVGQTYIDPRRAPYLKAVICYELEHLRALTDYFSTHRGTVWDDPYMLRNLVDGVAGIATAPEWRDHGAGFRPIKSSVRQLFDHTPLDAVSGALIAIAEAHEIMPAMHWLALSEQAVLQQREYPAAAKSILTMCYGNEWAANYAEQPFARPEEAGEFPSRFLQRWRERGLRCEFEALCALIRLVGELGGDQARENLRIDLREGMENRTARHSILPLVERRAELANFIHGLTPWVENPRQMTLF